MPPLVKKFVNFFKNTNNQTNSIKLKFILENLFHNIPQGHLAFENIEGSSTYLEMKTNMVNKRIWLKLRRIEKEKNLNFIRVQKGAKCVTLKVF